MAEVFCTLIEFLPPLLSKSLPPFNAIILLNQQPGERCQHPKRFARQNIDAQLTACGWVVQDRAGDEPVRRAGRGGARVPAGDRLRRLPALRGPQGGGGDGSQGRGHHRWRVWRSRPAVYAVGLPANIPHVTLPLPFLYESTGVETFFRDNRDPEPRSRRVFAFHRPETLADWLAQPDTLRARLQAHARAASP